MTRVLIIGANGMLGHALMQWQQPGIEIAGTLRNTAPTRFSCLQGKQLFYGVECADTIHMMDVLQQFRPDFVINCAGIVKQRDEAKDIQQMIATNALFPHMLAGMCRAQNVKLIHISTDCIFNGAKGRPYTEEDRMDADDLYGLTKYLGEISDTYSLTLRTSLIGRELQVKRGLMEWAISQRGTTILGYEQSLYSGLTTLEMAHLLMHVIQYRPALHGLYHVASPAISKYALLLSLNRALKLDLTIEKDTTVVCDRRLDGSKFYRASGYEVPAWETMIESLTRDACLHE